MGRAGSRVWGRYAPGMAVVLALGVLARLPGFYLDMFVGIMIVVGVVINQAIRRKF